MKISETINIFLQHRRDCIWWFMLCGVSGYWFSSIMEILGLVTSLEVTIQHGVAILTLLALTVLAVILAVIFGFIGVLLLSGKEVKM